MINDMDVIGVFNLDVREIEEKSESEEKGNFFFLSCHDMDRGNNSWEEAI